MDRVFETGAAGSAPSPPGTPSSGYPTAGNPGTGTPATKPGPWWYHQITEELRAVIVEGGLVPDHEVLTQLRDAINAIVSANVEPVASIKAFPLAVEPVGWLECDGSAISRTTYAALFAAIGTTFGDGDGSTTFDLPDLRGQFLRGWDHGAGVDPDAASRTDRGDGTTGDNVGTLQLDAFKAHAHSMVASGNLAQANTGSSVAGGSTSGGNSGSTGGNETRPKNMALMFCIKH